MNIARRIVVALVLLVGVVPVPGQAPESASDRADGGPTGAAPAAPPQPHHTVVVTATRTPTPSWEIGQSLTLITAQDIAAQGARDLLQVLERVPGFSVARSGWSGGTTSVFVRGGESDFNLVLIDGVQVNQPGGFYDFADLTTANVERIEIVRGPSSVLYGADAVSSVIHIVTRKGEGGFSGDLRLEGGTHHTYLLRAGVQGQARKLHYSLGTHYGRSDGFLDFNNDHDKVEVAGRSTLDLGSGSSVSAGFRLLDAEHRFPTDSTGRVIDPNDFRRSDERLYFLAYENRLTDRFSSSARYGYSSREFESFTVRDEVVDFFDSTFRTRESRHLLDWANHLQLGPDHLLTAGLSFEREGVLSSEAGRRSAGVYLQDQISWGDFFLTIGGRHDHNDRFRSFTTGTLSAAYRIGDHWKLRGSLGNGFRAPAFTEMVGFPDFGIRGNPDLSPEQNLAGEVGIDFLSADRPLEISATLFLNRFRDLIEFSFLVPAGSPNYLNVERARSEGVEVNGSLGLGDRVRVGGDYTLTRTRVTEAGTVPGGSFLQGEALLPRPRHLGGIHAGYLGHRFQLRLDLRYKGRRDDVQFFPDFSSSRVSLPSYWRTDLAVSLPLPGLTEHRGDVALVLRGENLLNRRYSEVAGFDSAGRILFAGLDITF